MAYRRCGKYTIDEVLKHVSHSFSYTKPKIMKFDGYKVKMNSQRYTLFKRDGVQCVSCGIKGEFFALERHENDKTSRPHFNLYGIDKDGNEVLMTKDHIIPKAKGGKNALSNYQVMCVTCNNEKSDFEDCTGIIGYRILKVCGAEHKFSKWYAKTKENLNMLLERIILSNAATAKDIRFSLRIMT